MITVGGRLVAALALVVAVAGSGGCSSPSDGAMSLPSLSESGSAAPSESTSATPSGSISTDPRAEVEAAVRAYFAAMDLAGRTGNVEPYKAATTDACTCRQFATAIEEAYSQAPLEGAGVVLDSAVVNLLQPGRANVTVEYRTLAYAQTVSAKPTRYPGASVQSLVRLQQTAGGWLVVDEDVLSRDTT